jgi:beta-N-acetylhexosaminidase
VRRAGPALLAALLIAVAGCGTSRDEPVPEGGSSYGEHARTTRGHETLADALAPVLVGSSLSARAQHRRRADPRDVLGLSPERAAARLLLVGFKQAGPFERRLRVRDYGAVLLRPGNYSGDTQLAALTGSLAAAARRGGHAPPVVVGDQLPPALEALRSLGVGATLGPVADLATTGGPHERDAFSDDPKATAGAVARAVAIRSAAGLASAVGHFPGEGAAAGDPDLEPATVGLSLADLRHADVLPFARVARRAAAVEMSTALYTAFDSVTPATELPEAVALLRSLRFHGVVISGDLTVAAETGEESIGEVAVAALKAGCDLLQVPGDAAAQEDAYRSVARAIRRGSVSPGHIAAALRRVALLQRRHD